MNIYIYIYFPHLPVCSSIFLHVFCVLLLCSSIFRFLIFPLVPIHLLSSFGRFHAVSFLSFADIFFNFLSFSRCFFHFFMFFHFCYFLVHSIWRYCLSDSLVFFHLILSYMFFMLFIFFNVLYVPFHFLLFLVVV